jgi:mannan endo-1,4-beta-mannosidase
MVVAPSGRVARPSYNTGTGFFVLNGQLYDPNGNPFRIRGTDRAHYDMGDQPGISRAGANTVRFFMWNIGMAGLPPASTYANVAQQQHINYGELPIIVAANIAGTSNNTSGDTNPANLATTVNWWVANVSAFAPIMDRIAINVANEWGPMNSPAWATAYESAIAQLRAAGYTCPLVIDAGRSGQDPSDVLNYGQQVFASDPQKNVIFSLHVYNFFYDSVGGVAQQWSSQPDLQPTTDALAATGLPIIYGEFGPGRNVGPAPTLLSPARVIQAAEGANFGWMAWAWDDLNLANCMGDNNWFGMTYNCGRYSVPSDLTWFGLDMALNPAYGWDALASPAPVFLP